MHGLRMQDLRQHTLNVLVVDDEELNLEIISELLGDRGYHVDTADSGVLACRLLQQNSDKYHCVLLDRMMPELDGMAVLQFMKNDPQLRYIPVIMQTAKATRKDIQDGINAGVLYYITKPFNETTLLNIVDSAVAEYLEMQALTRGQVRHPMVNLSCVPWMRRAKSRQYWPMPALILSAWCLVWPNC